MNWLTTILQSITLTITPRGHPLLHYQMRLRTYISKKLATVVEGDPKVPRCREGAIPFLGLLHFTLDPYLIMLSVQQGSIKYHFFESLV